MMIASQPFRYRHSLSLLGFWVTSYMLISRSEKGLLIRLRPFSNKAMIGWAFAALTILFIVIGIPRVSIYLKLSTPTIGQGALVFFMCFLATSWQELGELHQ